MSIPISTQDPSHPTSTLSTGISMPFSLTPVSSQQAFRLLELPDELLDIIATAQKDDRELKLRLKSGVQGRGRGGEGQGDGDGQLHLCTEDKAWKVRQVSTSNSVHICAPTNKILNGEDIEMQDAGEDGVILQKGGRADGRGITAISQSSSVLELVPTTTSIPQIEDALRDKLAVYRGVRFLHRTASRQRAIDDISAPDRMIEQAMDRLFVSHVGKGYGQVYFIPSDELLVEVWRRIVESAAIEGIRLDGEVDIERVLQGVREDPISDNSVGYDDDDNNVHGNIAGVMLRACLLSLGIAIKSNGHRLNFDPEKLTQWLGRLLLKTHRDDEEAVPLKEFLEEWKGLVPVEKWWGHVSIATLEPNCQIGRGKDGEETVKWAEGVVEGVRTGKDGGGPGAGTGAGTGKKPIGKWHEKFAKQRQAKK